jgi:hypothetical protein
LAVRTAPNSCRAHSGHGGVGPPETPGVAWGYHVMALRAIEIRPSGDRHVGLRSDHGKGDLFLPRAFHSITAP